MFGLGTSELLIILVIVMLVFGASRLPQLGKGLGEGMRSFKDAIKGGGDEKPAASNQSKKEIDSQV
jgi:sec-independent protein translocase protein TatA